MLWSVTIFSDLVFFFVHSQIYCEGEILHTVQMSRLFKDSKTFVDLRLLFDEEEIVRRFKLLKNQTGTLSLQQIRDFVNQNFAEDPLVKWVPPDLKAVPSIIADIEDDDYKRWILSLNQIWKELAAKVTDDARDNPKKHSIIYLPNGFIKVILI